MWCITLDEHPILLALGVIGLMGLVGCFVYDVIHKVHEQDKKPTYIIYRRDKRE